VNGWRGARPELAVAAGLIVILSAAAWAIDGPTTASVVVLASVAISLILLRGLVVHEDPPGEYDPESLPAPRQAPDDPGALGLEQIRLSHTFTSFWRTQSDLTSATKSLSAWDYGARTRLTNLLAARLAERHGITMAHEPAAAKRLLLGEDDRHDLWFWIDPRRPSPPDASSRPGIPPAALAALIERLEQL
jgi:hypothetical protein